MVGLMKRKIWGVSLVLILFPALVLADVSLPGFQQLGDNSHLTVTADELRDYPFYFSLSSDISISKISLSNVSGLEPDSSLVVFIDGDEVGTGTPGAEQVDVDLSLAAGLHTLNLRGSCYDNGVLTPCSGVGSSAVLSIDDLPDTFIDPVTDLIDGDLNDPFTGTNQSDGVEITGDSNAGIDLESGDDRLYIHGNINGTVAITLGGGDDIIRIGGDKNAPLDLGGNDNHCQIDGNVNVETISGGNQSDTVKIKGAVNADINLFGGNDWMEILLDMNANVDMGKKNDKLYIHGDVNGTGVDMGRGSDILRIDGQISSPVDGGNGQDTLYVNMTEAEWAGNWQQNNVTNFETIICTDTVIVGLDEDDFNFDEIILTTVDSSQTTDAIHFMQKYHLGDNDDSDDGYGDIASNYHPYYPDDKDAKSVAFTFNLTIASTHLDIDFYRIRSLDFNNPVYVDGVAVGSLTDGGDSVDLAQDPYTISIDGDWGAGDHTLKIESDREWYWWDYDDFSWDEIIITPEVSSFIDHYRIEHPATGITCQASTVTIRACADSDCTTEYADPTTVTLTATATDGTPTWVGGATRTFTGHTEVQLRQTIPATVTLDLTSTGIAPSNPTQCYEDGVLGDCSIEFYESGFLLTVEDGRSCEELNGTIQAVQTDDETNLCVGDDSFAGKTKEVGFWFNYAQPDSGTHSPAIDTTLIDTTPTSVGFSMVFDTQAKATYSLTYNDAGSLNLYARHEGSGDSAGLVMTTIGSTAASFVVAPHHFEVTSPLDNSSTSGTTTGIAAEPFEATITAVCQNGNPTPNFAAQTTLSAKTPSDPDNNLGTFSSGGLSTEDFNEGEANPTDLSYDEVGNFTLKAESTDYLSSGMDINGTTVVGRFIPHHFELSQGSLNNRSELGCAITPSFTYLDENLEFAFNLTAVNAADDITENYFGLFAKFEGETISANYTIGAAGNIPDGSTTKLTTRLDDIIVSRIADWTDGNAGFTVKLNVDRLPQPYGPFTDTRFGIFVRDSDGVEIEPLDLDVDNDSNNDYAQAAENTLLRYGRIRLENAHGSELLPLSMPVYAEYFDGNGFINNADDTCSLFNVSDLTCADVDTDDELTCTNVTVSGIDVGHDEFFTLPAPDNKATGALEYTLGVDSWLQYDWDNEDNDDDPLTGQDNPTARATFGIYKGSESIIYLRETTWR